MAKVAEYTVHVATASSNTGDEDEIVMQLQELHLGDKIRHFVEEQIALAHLGPMHLTVNDHHS